MAMLLVRRQQPVPPCALDPATHPAALSLQLGKQPSTLLSSGQGRGQLSKEPVGRHADRDCAGADGVAVPGGAEVIETECKCGA